MGSIIVRLVLLAGGLAFGEMSLDSLTRGGDIAVAQLGVALVLLVAGSAGFIVPLLSANTRQEASRHV